MPNDLRRAREDEGRGRPVLGWGLVVIAALVMLFAAKLGWDASRTSSRVTTSADALETRAEIEAGARASSVIGSIGFGVLIVGVALVRRGGDRR
jgi:hypothetical protein